MKKTTAFSILIVSLLSTSSSAQISFEKHYGGTRYDGGYSVHQTSDGGYIIGGFTDSFGSGDRDVYLIKTAANGDMLWSRTYGGVDYDVANSLQITSDGGLIIVGFTYSFGSGSSDVYLIKTSDSGDTLWTRTYGGTESEEGYFVEQTQDGGYIITGTSNSFGTGSEDVYLIKTDASGNALWTRTYGGSSGYDVGRSVHQTSNGGYVIGGFTTSFGAGSDDVYLIRTGACQ